MTRPRFELTITEETKEAVKRAAVKRYGKPNVTMLIRALIAEHLSTATAAKLPPLRLGQGGRNRRLQVSISADAYDLLSAKADTHVSTIQYYVSNLIYTDLGAPQLLADQIETLRRSNYEMAKIGTNLNQLSKAFNTLLKMQSNEPLPDVSKRIQSLKKSVDAHTKTVLAVLQTKTVVLEREGRGQRRK